MQINKDGRFIHIVEGEANTGCTISFDTSDGMIRFFHYHNGNLYLGPSLPLHKFLDIMGICSNAHSLCKLRFPPQSITTSVQK